MIQLPPEFKQRAPGFGQLGECTCTPGSVQQLPPPVPPAVDKSSAWADAFTVASVFSTLNNLFAR